MSKVSKICVKGLIFSDKLVSCDSHMYAAMVNLCGVGTFIQKQSGLNARGIIYMHKLHIVFLFPSNVCNLFSNVGAKAVLEFLLYSSSLHYKLMSV